MRSHLIIFSLFFTLLSVGQTDAEKAVLNLMNQVRTNPQLFLKVFALPYIEKNELKRNRYAKSLIRELERKDSIQPLKFENALQGMSEEFAKEAGRKGWVGHRHVDQRFKKHAEHLDVTAENLQYGYESPIDIVMDLLIDFDTPNLGHRKNILDESFSLIGISIQEHKSYDYITVMSFGGIQ